MVLAHGDSCMAMILLSIVLAKLAAELINIYLSIANQRSIKRLTAYVTPVKVQRQGSFPDSTGWTTVDLGLGRIVDLHHFLPTLHRNR
jgi:hypothetical protein